MCIIRWPLIRPAGSVLDNCDNVNTSDHQDASARTYLSMNACSAFPSFKIGIRSLTEQPSSRQISAAAAAQFRQNLHEHVLGSVSFSANGNSLMNSFKKSSSTTWEIRSSQTRAPEGSLRPKFSGVAATAQTTPPLRSSQRSLCGIEIGRWSCY